MKKTRLPCLILAIETDVGSGKSMEVYYRALQNSDVVIPIMMYTSVDAFHRSPYWVKNKIATNIQPTTHELVDCNPRFCSLPPNEHRGNAAWTADFLRYITYVQSCMRNRLLYVLDTISPGIEKGIQGYIIQVFHGWLFDEGKSYFADIKTFNSFNHYWLMFPYGQRAKRALCNRAGLRPHDARIKMIGRVLNDTLYNSSIHQKDVLQSYNLDPNKKTILYAPSWKSTKIWPIGNRSDDMRYLERFCTFTQAMHVNLIVRPHPLSIFHYHVGPLYARVLSQFNHVYYDDTSHSTIDGPNHTLAATDILVTDLSTIAIDFLSLQKPAVFFYPDPRIGMWGNVPSYKQIRRISYTVRRFPQLLTMLRRLITTKESLSVLKHRKQFIKQAFAHTDGHASERFRTIVEQSALRIPLYRFKNTVVRLLAAPPPQPNPFIMQLLDM